MERVYEVKAPRQTDDIKNLIKIGAVPIDVDQCRPGDLSLDLVTLGGDASDI